MSGNPTLDSAGLGRGFGRGTAGRDVEGVGGMAAAWRRHGGGMARARVSASRAQARGIPETVLNGGA